MGGLACAHKIITNYAVLAPESTALAMNGNTPIQQEAAALAQAAQACCMAYTEAYGDPFVQLPENADDKARLIAVMRAEAVDAMAMAKRLRVFRVVGNRATNKITPDVIRDCRDKMVDAFLGVIVDLMDEYYPPATDAPAPKAPE